MKKLDNLPFQQPDYDANWKTLLENFAEQAVQKFFPNLASQRDFSKPITFEDKELQKIFSDWKKKGWTMGDKLMKVPLKNKRPKLVLIHFDIHRTHERKFKKLMWRRAYRIMDKHVGTDFTAIAVYIGNRVPPKPNEFVYEYEGTKMIYIFNTFIVKDQIEEKLLASNNPLDIAILAMYYVLKAGGDYDFLKRAKIKLARLCFEKGFSKRETYNLIIFVSFTIALPKEDEQDFFNEIVPMMTEKRTPYREQNPVVSRFLEPFFFGKTYEEMIEEITEKAEAKVKETIKEEVTKEVKDELKKEFLINQIISFYKRGKEIQEISSLLEIDEKKVRGIIKDFEKGKDTNDD